MSNQNIVVSDINREDNKKEIILERKIYIDCLCNGINHIGRVILNRKINKNDTSSIFTMWLETNAQSYFNSFYAYNTNLFSKMMLLFQFLRFKFFDIIKRLKMAFNILFNRTVYIPLDWELMDETIIDLAETIKKSYNEMKKVNNVSVDTVKTFLKNNFDLDSKEINNDLLSFIQLNYYKINNVLIDAKNCAKNIFGNDLKFDFEIVYLSNDPKLFVHINSIDKLTDSELIEIFYNFELLTKFDEDFYLKLENDVTDLISFTLGE